MPEVHLQNNLAQFSSSVIRLRKNGEMNMRKPSTEELRKHYILNPPEGMTSQDIQTMSDDDLLDMDYFLNEDDPFNDDFDEEGFYLF